MRLTHDTLHRHRGTPDGTRRRRGSGAAAQGRARQMDRAARRATRSRGYEFALWTRVELELAASANFGSDEFAGEARAGPPSHCRPAGTTATRQPGRYRGVADTRQVLSGRWRSGFGGSRVHARVSIEWR